MYYNSRTLILIIFLLVFGWTLPSHANDGKSMKGLERIPQQHALVVGINQYQYAGKIWDVEGSLLKNLNGAVNDAKVLAKALRHAQINLPEQRILLNTKATRAAFLQAWQNMVKQANPKDTLIVTFSGHGFQYQSDISPKDEKDNKDEGLIFSDFNPKHPRKQGHIRDDELYGLFKAASDYQIVFVVDACHSRGMVRSAVRPVAGQVRTGGKWNLVPTFPTLPTQGDDQHLEHVTFMTAVHSDSLRVSETTFANQAHGALSWYFAQALNGDADSNQNGYLERSELDDFLTEKIRKKTNGLQFPNVLPRADMQPVIKLPSDTALKPPPTHPNIPDIAIVVEHTRAPAGLKHVRFVNSFQTFDLLFAVNKQQIDVFNNTGDKVTTLSSSQNRHRWQQLIDKKRFLKFLETQFDMRLKPIRITLLESDKLHKEGEKLHFRIEPSDKQQGLNALTIFDLAGNGELQFLYPLTDPKFNNPLIIQKFPYTSPPMEVIPPYGGDDLVVLLCEKPTTGLHILLKETQPNIPNFNTILLHLSNNRCQVGQYAFFSGE